MDEEKDYCLVEIDSDEVDCCVKLLMQHIMEHKPFGGKVTDLGMKPIPAERRHKALCEVEAMIHAAIVSIAYREAVNMVTFDGMRTAADVINLLFVDKSAIPDQGASMILEAAIAMAQDRVMRQHLAKPMNKEAALRYLLGYEATYPLRSAGGNHFYRWCRMAEISMNMLNSLDWPSRAREFLDSGQPATEDWQKPLKRMVELIAMWRLTR